MKCIYYLITMTAIPDQNYPSGIKNNQFYLLTKTGIIHGTVPKRVSN